MHGEVVIFPAIIYQQLFGKVLKRVKTVRGIETLVILAMASLYFAVMSGSEGPDLLMPDPILLQPFLEQGQIGGGVRLESFGEFRSVIGLYALDGEREGLYQMLQKDRRGIRAVLLKGFHIAPAGVFVDRRVLEKLSANDLAVFQAGGRDEFHVDLNALAGIAHLLIGLGNVLGVWRLDRHDPLASQNTVQTGDGTLIAALSELHPEDNQTGMGVTASHIGNQFQLRWRMLIGMAVWPSGEISERVPGAVITVLPAVDILAIDVIADSRF